MALMDEVRGEILQRHEEAQLKPVPTEGAAQPKKRRRRRKTLEDMTPDEVEAFKQRKMMEEEARVLGKPLPAEPKKRRRRKSKMSATDEAPKTSRAARTVKKKTVQPAQGEKLPIRRVRRKAQGVQSPQMLQPLQPLYLLKIPGLPEGDCIAICYARGADHER